MSILFSQKTLKYNEIRPLESKFTEVLDSIAVKPKMLYFHGKIPENRLKTVAIVGTRRPTEYGRKVAFELAQAVAKNGAVVVSGLAYGIDGIAARGALAAGGLTMAVLGTPIDQIYPRAHCQLAEEIVQKNGAIISELPPGAEFFPKTTFLQRNRIIAGLADVVVIPEAAQRSGSLNTAARALEQGKEIFAVPGGIDRPMSVGCNQLIRQGATPYLEIDDVLRVIFPEKYQKKSGKLKKTAKLEGDSEAESLILATIARVGAEGMSCEEVLEKTGLAATTLVQNMAILELKGKVRMLAGGMWGIV